MLIAGEANNVWLQLYFQYYYSLYGDETNSSSFANNIGLSCCSSTRSTKSMMLAIPVSIENCY